MSTTRKVPVAEAYTVACGDLNEKSKHEIYGMLKDTMHYQASR